MSSCAGPAKRCDGDSRAEPRTLQALEIRRPRGAGQDPLSGDGSAGDGGRSSIDRTATSSLTMTISQSEAFHPHETVAHSNRDRKAGGAGLGHIAPDDLAAWVRGLRLRLPLRDPGGHEGQQDHEGGVSDGVGKAA